MKADLSLPGWGGWFALPPPAEGGPPSSPDGIRCPSLGQAADRHSCAQHYNISQNQLWAAGRCCRVPGKYLF